MRGNENPASHTRQLRGGGGVQGAPGKWVGFSEPPFPHLGSGVALNMEGVKGEGSKEQHVGKALGHQRSAAARGHFPPEAGSQEEGQCFVERGLGLCPGIRGVGISSARPTLRVWDPVLILSLERSWESYRMPETPSVWGAREGLCITHCKATRLALADWNPAAGGRGMGGGHYWQKCPELPSSGLCGPPAACAASPRSCCPL